MATERTVNRMDEERSERPAPADLLIVDLSLLAVGCWLPLYRWYSIAGHYY